MITKLLLKTWHYTLVVLFLIMSQQARAAYLTSIDEVTTGYYKVYSLSYNATMAMSEASTGSSNVFCDTPDANDYMQVWYIVVDASKSTGTTKAIQLQNAVSERWIDRAGNLIQTYTNHSSTPFTLAYTDAGFTIARGNGLHHQ